MYEAIKAIVTNNTETLAKVSGSVALTRNNKLRQQVTKQPGTCLNCHASVYVAYKQLGGGDILKGFEALNKMPYFDARKLVTHPVACLDCHDPQTMQLRYLD